MICVCVCAAPQLLDDQPEVRSCVAVSLGALARAKSKQQQCTESRRQYNEAEDMTLRMLLEGCDADAADHVDHGNTVQLSSEEDSLWGAPGAHDVVTVVLKHVVPPLVRWEGENVPPPLAHPLSLSFPSYQAVWASNLNLLWSNLLPEVFSTIQDSLSNPG